MQQTDPGLYTVTDGETVTLRVEAVKVTPKLSIFHSSVAGEEELNPTSDVPLKYEFTVSSTSGDEGLDIGCVFADADDPQALYRFFVQGSKGGGEFKATTVRKTDSKWDISLDFELPGA
jgi:hypothetical protein